MPSCTPDSSIKMLSSLMVSLGERRAVVREKPGGNPRHSVVALESTTRETLTQRTGETNTRDGLLRCRRSERTTTGGDATTECLHRRREGARSATVAINNGKLSALQSKQ